MESESADPGPQPHLAESITIPSDSESYAANHELSSSSPPSSSTSPLVVYAPPTIWSLLRGAAINLLLPFVNGLMLGFGELLAHEAAFRLGWGGTKVSGMVFANYSHGWRSSIGHFYKAAHDAGRTICHRHGLEMVSCLGFTCADSTSVRLGIPKSPKRETVGARYRSARHSKFTEIRQPTGRFDQPGVKSQLGVRLLRRRARGG